MATIPFTYECSKDGGFVMDPNEHKRVGYVTELKAFTIPFNKDLKVSVPFNQSGGPEFAALKYTRGIPGATAEVIGVIEQFEWNGGVGDPLKLEFYVSQENAQQFKSLQQRVLQTTKVEALAWWIAGFDQESKVWFEQAFPATGPITGIIAGKENPELDVDLSPVPVKDGVDVNVYKISLAVVPAANKQYALHFANSSRKPVVKSWGLVVGAQGAAL